MTTTVPSHAHLWYPIAYDASGVAALWACGVYRGCVKTLNSPTEYQQELRKAQQELRKAQEEGWQTIEMEEPK